MTHHKVKPLRDTVKVTMMMLLVSFCLPLIGCSRARNVDKLIQELKDENSDVRWKAAYALGKIKDARAVEPLIAALKDEDPLVRSGAAYALAEIKDARAAEALIVALKDEDLRIAAIVYPFFIRQGISGSETVLVKALNRHGNVKMAEDFLNCGNPQLGQAGGEWANTCGYLILPAGRGGPRWGSSR